MSPSKRFKPVQQVAKNREKSAAKELGDSQRLVRDQEARLEDLKRYHRDYLGRFETSARNGMSAGQLQEYRAFLDKLDRAIQEQERVVQMTRVECSNRKDVWQQKRVRTQALGKVVDRFRSAEIKADEERDQKESDERSQRRGDPY